MNFAADDARFMARAVQLARRGWRTTTPNPRVGCVLVRDGKIIGEGWHEKAGGPHAEVAAIKDASSRNQETAGATAYVTLEPCCVHGRTPPCTQALQAAGVSRVVVGATDPNPAVDGGGLTALADTGMDVTSGVLNNECEALNRGFRLRMTEGRPRFTVKIAMTLDGRTAAASGESQWITGPAARRDVHGLRADSCAVLTGRGTVLADDPSLNARDVAAQRQPARLVLDTKLRTPPGAKIFTEDGQRLVFSSSSDQSAIEAIQAVGAQVIAIESDNNGRLNLRQVATELGRLQFNDVLVEAGAQLAGAFVAAGLADELIIYMAPQLLGDSARPMLAMPGLDKLSDRVHLQIIDIRGIGPDWRIIARPSTPAVPAGES